MSLEYLILVAVLLFYYICLRCALTGAVRLPPAPSKPADLSGKAIEVTQLSHRMQHLKKELAEGKTPLQPAGFKRAFMVESRRAQIANLAFFQTSPPAPEPPEPEPGLHLLLV